VTETLGLYGGAFDPPHRGHVALAHTAKRELGLDRLIVLVAADPGHKHVATSAAVRLELARAAFPDDDVVLDEHARTVETLRAHPEWRDPIFLIGADQFADFLDWTDPDEVLARTRIAVATRPGFPAELLRGVLDRIEQPDRVSFFELEPVPVSSSDLRARAARSESLAADVPAAAAEIIEREGLYRRAPGYTGAA
jgi:nicotinate-nucleotide adenylyltransferase